MSFFLMVFIRLDLEVAPSILVIGKGIIFPSFPSFTLNIRSKFNTFNSEGLGFPKTALTFWEIILFPSNLALKVFVSLNGLDHFLLELLYFLFCSIYFIKNFFYLSIFLLLPDNCAIFLAFRLSSLDLTRFLLILGIDMVEGDRRPFWVDALV